MASFDRKKSNQVRVVKPTHVPKKRWNGGIVNSGHQSKSVVASKQGDTR